MDETTRTLDPMIDDPSIPDAAQKWLHLVEELGDPNLAYKQIWVRHKIRVSVQQVASWCASNQVFKDAYDTLRSIQCGEVTKQQMALAMSGRMSGGANMAFMQEKNR